MIVRMILFDLIKYLKKYIFKYKWRKNNHNNFTKVNDIFPMDMVEVGIGTYGTLNVRSWNKPDVKLIIGSYCSIARDVVFMLSGEHYYKTVSTYPFNAYYYRQAERKTVSKGNIIVGDDVWFGERCIILSGVTIGQGAIIGAGSIVSKDIPPYAIYAGNRILKYRFSDDIIDKLLKLDYSKLTKEDILQYKDNLYVDVDENFFEKDFYKKNCK